MNPVRVAVRLRPRDTSAVSDPTEIWSHTSTSLSLDAPPPDLATPRSQGSSSSASHTPRQRRDEKTFTFDSVYAGTESQEEFFGREVMPLLAQGLALAGEASASPPPPPCHVTIFAYGQTGSGKTFTVDGPPPKAIRPPPLPQATRSCDDDALERKQHEGEEDDAEGEMTTASESGKHPIIESEAAAREDDSMCGIAPRVIKALFAYRGRGTDPRKKDNADSDERDGVEISGAQGYVPIRIGLSFMELYQEKIYDLLNTVTSAVDGEPLRVKKAGRNGIVEAPTPQSSCLRMRRDKSGKYVVENLCRFVCETEAEALRFYSIGSSRKTFRGHLLNARSSRAHTLLNLYVTLQKVGGGDDDDNGAVPDGNEMEVEVVVVDLAGSERLKSIMGNSNSTGSSNRPSSASQVSRDRGAAGTLVSESVSINKSLLTLGKVISMLADNAALAQRRSAASSSSSATTTFVPYRDSKLTMLLSNALGGNSVTLMVACIHSAADQVNESLSTLYYANRTRKIVNTRKVIEDPRSAKIRQLSEEVASLRKELAIANETIVMLRSSVKSSTPQVAASGGGAPTAASGPSGSARLDSMTEEENGEDPLLAQLANSLIDSCSKLQDVLGANKRLRESLDEARRVAHLAVREKEQLEKEDLELRARLDAYDVLLVEQVAARTAQTIISKASPSANRSGGGVASPPSVRRTKHQRHYPAAPKAPNVGSGRPASASGSVGVVLAPPPPSQVSSGVPFSFLRSALQPSSSYM